MAGGTAAGALLALRYGGGVLRALDQTRLPWEEVELELRDADAVIDAVRRLAIRGAPLIGVAGAYAVALELRRHPEALERTASRVAAARPTAVNLAWAVRRVQAAARAHPEHIADAALAEAQAIDAEETAASQAMAEHGAELLSGQHRLLTHCNTGALAAPGRGTALAVVAELHARGELERVLVSESRPLLQGARLTVYELRSLGVAHELIVDGASAGLIAGGAVDAVVVGCDRVAANGDVANKVGTFAHALAAAAAEIPFVVVGPTSTIDPDCPAGNQITIEQRDPDEVRQASTDTGARPLAPEDTPARNPAFDVTPAAYVSALVTERGVVSPARAESVLTLLGR